MSETVNEARVQNWLAEGFKGIIGMLADLETERATVDEAALQKIRAAHAWLGEWIERHKAT